MSNVPTVMVFAQDGVSSLIINQEDFNPEVHKLYVPEAPAPVAVSEAPAPVAAPKPPKPPKKAE